MLTHDTACEQRYEWDWNCALLLPYCFADLTGLRRPLRMSYLDMAQQMKQDLDTELGFTFSVGLAPNKVVAKIASKWQKPSGLTAIPGRDIRYWGAMEQKTRLSL